MSYLLHTRQTAGRWLLAMFAMLVFSAVPTHALGLDCDNVDGQIADAQKSANEEFAKANALQAAVNAAPSLWDNVTDSLAIWNPFSTSIGDAAEGAAQDAILSACGTVAKRAAAGIDLTNKLIQQADVLVASQGAGVASANARAARIRGHKWMKEANRLLRWKQEHCQCTEDAEGNAELEGDDNTKGNLLDWLERSVQTERSGGSRKDDSDRRDGHSETRKR